MTEVALASIPRSQSFILDAGANQDLENAIRQEIQNSVDSSPIFNSYIRWLPVTSAFTIWVLLEFLRGLILSNIGGLFSTAILRSARKKR